ncbi:MAG: hypothetical protein IT529_13185 [Burkholderiales bacterium]|nr:hypothetical protein [Burkholderiales bacterium]
MVFDFQGAPGRPPLPGVPTLAGQQREFVVLRMRMLCLREGLREAPRLSRQRRDCLVAALTACRENQCTGTGKMPPPA